MTKEDPNIPQMISKNNKNSCLDWRLLSFKSCERLFKDIEQGDESVILSTDECECVTKQPRNKTC